MVPALMYSPDAVDDGVFLFTDEARLIADWLTLLVAHLNDTGTSEIADASIADSAGRLATRLADAAHG